MLRGVIKTLNKQIIMDFNSIIFSNFATLKK